jgi:hypothetical protein
VGCAERIVHKDIAQLAQAGPEGADLILARPFALLGGVEAQVLEQLANTTADPCHD